MHAMTHLPTHAVDAFAAANATAQLPPLRMDYTFADATEVLAQSDVLAVIGFGMPPLANRDPRSLSLPLENMDATTPLEVWRGNGPVQCGVDGILHWASNGDYTFLSLALEEASHGGIAPTAQAAYSLLSRWRHTSDTPHFLRLWNYLDAINEGDGDAERYRQFCAGRATGMDSALAAAYPAATAIGIRDGRRILYVYALAARQAGVAVENPRQVNAWRYPRQYGPAAPGFVRGMRAPTTTAQLFISGTAAIVGHMSRHAEDTDAQLDETLANLRTLLNAAGSRTPLGDDSLLKVYLRRANDAQAVSAALRQELGEAVRFVLLGADICRRELLLEIDGVHGG
jgi:chorismate lyase/3-hydroxybenzoate synthase